jgi:hypothetical protein
MACRDSARRRSTSFNRRYSGNRDGQFRRRRYGRMDEAQGTLVYTRALCSLLIEWNIYRAVVWQRRCLWTWSAGGKLTLILRS